MRRPLNVILDLTSRCNLKCRMCYFAATDELRFPPFDEPPPERGLMPLDRFERVAEALFPSAHRVALGCAAEPLLHPDFAAALAVAARFRVPDLWFPTNLLPLGEAAAEAVVSCRVRTVAVSVDGTDAATYEAVRRGARWTRLLDRLELLRRVRRERRSRRPRLRLIFTWMRTNRDHLRRLPELAADLGFAELDVRLVTPTVGVEVGPELLDGEDPAALTADLVAAARDAVARGLRLVSYPPLPGPEPRTVGARLRHRLWLLRAGLDRPELRRHAARERRQGCRYPGFTFLVRPNGTVLPCPFWQEQPIGATPPDDLAALLASPGLARICDGLRRGRPVGSCADCGERQAAFHRVGPARSRAATR